MSVQTVSNRNTIQPNTVAASYASQAQKAPSFRDDFKNVFCTTVAMPGTFLKEVGQQAHIPQSTPWKQGSQIAQFGARIGYAPLTVPAGVVIGAGHGAAMKILSKA